jgi:exosortase/archaeosortase family protein
MTDLTLQPLHRLHPLQSLHPLKSLQPLPPLARPVRAAPLWLLLQAAALWPHGHWLLRRVQDGSDEPLGLVALAALAVLWFRLAPVLRCTPQRPALAAAAGLTLAANGALWFWPPLACTLLAALALAAALWAWLPAATPRAALAGLLVLAVPLLASLQYYAGYPLRLLTAQASTLLLQAAGYAAERSGATLLVQGQWVIVDAPCSGVQMAWFGYFCACAVAAFGALPDRSFLRRLPAVGALVLAGNVLRNTVLVALEARPQRLAPEIHQAIGLIVLAALIAAVARLMQRGRDARST